MSRTYAAMTTLIRTKIQGASTADYTVAELAYQIEECLKEFSVYMPHIVPVLFKIESRTGTATSTSANNLVDTTKGQFLATDDDNEKVVHNITDDTWAVISSYASTSSVGLTKDIFTVNEQYEIYNRECRNKFQIYLGDMPETYGIEAVEYPIGELRNWERTNVLKILVDKVDDSDSTLDPPGSTDVLVRFHKPQTITQLTDFTGTFSATAAAAATSIATTALQGAGTIEMGEEFHVQYHRGTYIVAASATIANSAATVTFYPPLEAAISSTAWTFRFHPTSLRPEDEELFADLVGARLLINRSPEFFNTVNVGGGNVGSSFMGWGNARLGEILGKLRRMAKPHTRRTYTRD